VREGLVVDEILEELNNGAYDLLITGASAADSGWGHEDVTERILLQYRLRCSSSAPQPATCIDQGCALCACAPAGLRS